MSITNFDQLLEAGGSLRTLEKKMEPGNGSLYFYGAQWYPYH